MAHGNIVENNKLINIINYYFSVYKDKQKYNFYVALSNLQCIITRSRVLPGALNFHLYNWGLGNMVVEGQGLES